MVDTMTAEQRHRCMSHIRSRDTRPETMVRHYLFSRGFRYRKNVRALPGTPDISLAAEDETPYNNSLHNK